MKEVFLVVEYNPRPYIDVYTSFEAAKNWVSERNLDVTEQEYEKGRSWRISLRDPMGCTWGYIERREVKEL